MQKTTIIAALLFVLGSVSAYAQQGSDVLLQGFYWNVHPGDSARAAGTSQGVWWDSLATVAPQLGSTGFASVWFPSPSKAQAGVQDMGYGPYDYYDLGELDQKGTIRTRFGTRSELMAAINALKGNGLSTMVDLVLGHRGGADLVQWKADAGICTVFDAECYQQAHDDGSGLQGFTHFMPASNRFPGDSTDFHPNSFPGHDNLNPPYHDKVFFEDLCYFHDLDNTLDLGLPNSGWYHGPHNLGALGDSLVVWGRYLMQDVGFDEVRLDAVKHIEPGFVAPFLVELSNGSQPYAVGEFFDGNAGAVASWQQQVEQYNSTFGTGSKDANMAMFDFPLRYKLRDMANNGSGSFNMWDLNTSGLKFGEGLAGEDIVTFVENHDVDRIGYIYTTAGDPAGMPFGNSFIKQGTDGGHDPVFQDKHMAYAYIMAAEGRPMVFWKDFFWYGLDTEISWLMAMRNYTAAGGSNSIHNLSPFFTSGHGGDLHVLNRYGSGGAPGMMLTLNDAPGYTPGAYVDSPFRNVELRDYSDAFLFTSTQVFNDGRTLVEASPRNYAWYAPTGYYPMPPNGPVPSFMMEAAPGGKLHHVVLRASDMASFMIDGSPIQPGDEVAIMGPSGDPMKAAGIGRVGQSTRWDGVHDMVIEVLGNLGDVTGAGRLEVGDALRLVVRRMGSSSFIEAGTVTFATIGTGFDFSANRPASRGGSTPFSLTTSGEALYMVGGISLVSGFEAVSSAGVCSGSTGAPAWDGTITSLPDGRASITLTADEGVASIELDPSSQNLALIEVQNTTGDTLPFTGTGVIGAGTSNEGFGQLDYSGTSGDEPTTAVLIIGAPEMEGSSFYMFVSDTCAPARTLRVDPVLELHTSTDSPDDVVTEYALDPAYPNPFNPQTNISFALPEAGAVTLDVYDMMGRHVTTLLDRTVSAGQHTTTFDASGLPSGVYLLRLQAGHQVLTRTVTLMK